MSNTIDSLKLALENKVNKSNVPNENMPNGHVTKPLNLNSNKTNSCSNSSEGSMSDTSSASSSENEEINEAKLKLNSNKENNQDFKKICTTTTQAPQVRSTAEKKGNIFYIFFEKNNWTKKFFSSQTHFT